jgi:2-amino-4-hydroxy-6-hydroxymethyldihydropteridine diphosphokinase
VPTAYLSLGSNLGNRKFNLKKAIRLLSDDLVRVRRVSPIYETAPRELLDQPWFLNLALEIETVLSAEELLARIAHVEAELGRQRNLPKGPRTVDIDILLYDDLVVNSPELTIPHRSMHERRFVLEPLADLAPDLRHPELGRTITELLAGLEDQQVHLYPRQ